MTYITRCFACGRWMRDVGYHVVVVADRGDGPTLDGMEEIGAFCEVCRRRIRKYARRRLPEERRKDAMSGTDVDRDLEWGCGTEEEI